MNGRSATAPRTGHARWVPGLAMFAHYPRDALHGDVVAGVSAFLVMIASVLAYSVLVDVAPVTGLHAAIGGMMRYACSRAPPR